MEDKFSITITEEDGKMSMVVCDYKSGTKVTLTQDDFDKFIKPGFNIGSMAKMLLETVKPTYRKILKNHHP